MLPNNLSLPLRVLAWTIVSLSACDRAQHDPAPSTAADAHASHAAAPDPVPAADHDQHQLPSATPSAPTELPTALAQPTTEPKPSKARKSKPRAREDVVTPEPEVEPPAVPAQPVPPADEHGDEHPHHHHH